MKNLPRFLSVFAGCIVFLLAGTACTVTDPEKAHIEKQRAELEEMSAMYKASVDALIAKEADPNDAKSIYELGVRYRDGDGVRMDPILAPELFQRAAEMGYAEAQYALGREYIDHIQEIMPRDAAMAEGVKWFEKAAKQGHIGAQLELAKLYATGKGVKEDEAKAFKIYKKAADAGSAEAMYKLTRYYNLGRGGVKKDKDKARELLRKSAEAGYAEAQRSLGLDFQHGYNTPVDLSEAVKWYTLAAEQGDSSSKAYLERLKDAIPLLEPAERGNADAQYKLAQYIIEHDNIGNSSDKSRPEAIRKWLLKAAENGHAAAQLELAEAYAYFDNGIWWIATGNDLAEAAKWYRKAAEQGDPMGQGMLGWFYATGRGVDRQSFDIAVEWFRKGAAQGNAEAQFGMGFCVREGWLTPYNEMKDWKTVVDWYVKAAESGLKHKLSQLENRRDMTGLHCKIAELYQRRYNLAKLLRDKEPFKNEPADQYLAETVNWYRKAAEAHDSNGFYKLSELAENDCEEAKEALRVLAKNGNRQAQTYLGPNGWGEPESEAGE